MRDRWLALGALATIGAAFVAAVAQAGPRDEAFPLDPNLPRVSATASLTRGVLTVSVEGAPARARVDAAADLLACTAGGDVLGSALTDATGRSRWTARTPLADRLRDGRHVLAVRVGSTTIACGAIPSRRPTAHPARQRHWGIWSFSRHFVG
jgi:hypothetical protein